MSEKGNEGPKSDSRRRFLKETLPAAVIGAGAGFLAGKIRLPNGPDDSLPELPQLPPMEAPPPRPADIPLTDPTSLNPRNMFPEPHIDETRYQKEGRLGRFESGELMNFLRAHPNNFQFDSETGALLVKNNSGKELLSIPAKSEFRGVYFDNINNSLWILYHTSDNKAFLFEITHNFVSQDFLSTEQNSRALQALMSPIKDR